MEEIGHKYKFGISIPEEEWKVIFGEDDECTVKLEDIEKAPSE